MANSKGHKLSEYIKLNEKKDRRLKKYKKKKVQFSLHPLEPEVRFQR